MLPTNPTAPRVTVIDLRTLEKARLRVAAYCRVSSDSADQFNSYLAQVDFFTKHIAENPDWELVDVYADEGISGLDAKKRDEFNRMISDCRAGKIDRILVKSISRFARNTQDYLQYMRELLRLGVTIHFEKENLDTGKLSTEQVAAIYGAFAQMESTNHSNNMRFSVKMRMEKGIFTPSSMPFGYRLNGLEPEIVPEEAEIVRRIFAAALSGQGQRDIARELNELGVERGHGRTVWRSNTVSYILTNSFYTGDAEWHKTCATDTVPFRQVRNLGQKPKYHVEDDHPGIVSRDDFRRVQAVIAQRRDQFYDGAPSRSIFSKRLYCEQCGAVLRRKVNSGKVYWVCHRHDGDKRQCPSAPIPETKLTAACLRLWNKLTLYGQDVLSPLLEQLRDLRERELCSNRRLSDIDKEIAHISEQNLVLTRLQSNGYVDSALYLSQLDELDRQLRDLRRLRRKILESAGEDGQIQATEAILTSLEENPDWHDEITTEFFETLVERITVGTDRQTQIPAPQRPGTDRTNGVNTMAWQRKIPFGYQMQNGVIQLHPQEAETVQAIFTQYLTGASYLTIAEGLTEHGPRYHEHTPEWNKNMVKRILENKKYIGGEGYPRIVSDEDFLSVQFRKTHCARPVSRSAEIAPILGKTVCAVCGSPMRRDTRTHGRPRWQCQNPDCHQAVFISDEILSEQVAEKLKVLAQAPHLLPVPPVNQAVPSTDTVRLQNELTLALNRGSESPEYIKALALAAAAQRYTRLPDPTPSHEFRQLRARLEADPADADTLAALLSMAVQSVRLEPDKTIELELTNGPIITDTKEAHSA